MESNTVTQEEIINGNKLIADFMNWQHSEDPTIDLWEMSGLKYHSSWDWLMPVVEKIESLFEGALVFFIKDTRAYIEVDTQAAIVFDVPEVPDCYSGFCDTKLQATWHTIIQFITWYNTQKQSNGK